MDDVPFQINNGPFIECSELYKLIQKKDSRYLIIDIRKKTHYDYARIISDKIINIPQSVIKPGLYAINFYEYLKEDKHSTDLFKHRSDQYVDIVVLLDWDTKEDTLTDANSLNQLKDILMNMDPDTNYKQIKILNGGYQKWLYKYMLMILSNDEEALKIVESLNQNKLNNTKAFNNIKNVMDEGDTNVRQFENWDVSQLEVPLNKVSQNELKIYPEIKDDNNKNKMMKRQMDELNADLRKNVLSIWKEKEDEEKH